MAIPDAQLNTWSAPGSVTQSSHTYNSIKGVLENNRSPYYARDFDVFLQGSYKNDTNVYRDSDVDIVICLDQTYYSNTAQLKPSARGNYDGAFVPATYSLPTFKAHVLEWLDATYGSAVVPGNKAIKIQGYGTRRDADVLVCAEHRRYWEESTGRDSLYDRGISFWSGAVEIVNFPKQHADNCTQKHKETRQWFKTMVRVYKNMRNRMLEDGYLAEGIAPSYFIEGMLWNVPNGKFGRTFSDSFINTFNWVHGADRSTLRCANDLFRLLYPNAKECWEPANFETYLVAAKKYWEDWS